MHKTIVMWASMLSIVALVVAVLLYREFGTAPNLLSMHEVFASGKTQTCTFIQQTEGAIASGTVYTIPGKLRGDYTAHVSGQTMHSHMISDGQTSYIWGDENPSGYILTSEQIGGVSVLGPDIKAEFRCDTWREDTAVFTPPTDVTFTDISATAPTPPPS